MANQVEMYNYLNNKPVDITDNPPSFYGNNTSRLNEHTMPIDMKVEANRLDSFKHKNWKCFMDTAKLAKCGFHYTGEADHVKCAFCKVEIGQWVQGDDCSADHQRWSPRCPFLRGFEVGNVPIDPSDVIPRLQPPQDVCGPYMTEIRPNSFPEKYTRDIDITPVNKSEVNLNQIGLNPHQGPKHKQYCTEESRIRTFKEWPRVMKQKPDQLAEAGFFYNGRGDQTICFHCNVGLKDWEENDDPWEQHARWSPKCIHVLLNKGEEFVQQVSNRNSPILSYKDAKNIVEASKNSRDVPPEQSAPSSSSEKPETKNSSASEIPPSNNNAPSKKDGCLCEICLTEQWDVLFLPCKHALVCTKCAPALSICPLCRKPIEATLKIFPSCTQHDH